MPARFDPKLDVLPQAQRELLPLLAPAAKLSYVLYGGTAVALHLGHRTSIDFDFFRAEPLNKDELVAALPFLSDAQTQKEDRNTLMVNVRTPSGAVKLSFFGGIRIGHVNEPLRALDSALLVASLEDLLVTKLKAIVDRAEAKDYIDISAMLSVEVSLERGLGAFAAMYRRDPALPLKALGFFDDGDLHSLAKADRDRLIKARNRLSSIPTMTILPGLLAG